MKPKAAFPRGKRKDGEPKGICRACKHAEYQKHWRWHRVGRICPRCGERRACPEEIGEDYRAVCSTCARERVRERQREWARVRRLNDPKFAERMREAARLYKQRHPEKTKEIEHRRYEQIRADPVKWERHKGDQRMRYRMRQERKGKPVKPVSKRVYVQRFGSGRHSFANTLPVAPLRTVIDAWLPTEVEHQWTTNEHETTSAGVVQLAEIAGVSARRIGSILNGEQERVSLGVADALCVALNVPLASLYFEEPR